MFVVCAVLAAFLVHPLVPRFVRGQLPSTMDLKGLGYGAHATAYMLMSAVMLGLVRPRRWCSAGLLLLGIAAHGVLTEAAQFWIPARDCDPLDLAANLAGITVVSVVYAVILNRLLRFGPKDAFRCDAPTGKNC
jgi:hypothetical protein